MHHWNQTRSLECTTTHLIDVCFYWKNKWRIRVICYTMHKKSEVMVLRSLTTTDFRNHFEIDKNSDHQRSFVHHKNKSQLFFISRFSPKITYFIFAFLFLLLNSFKSNNSNFSNLDSFCSMNKTHIFQLITNPDQFWFSLDVWIWRKRIFKVNHLWNLVSYIYIYIYIYIQMYIYIYIYRCFCACCWLFFHAFINICTSQCNFASFFDRYIMVFYSCCIHRIRNRLTWKKRITRPFWEVTGSLRRRRSRISCSVSYEEHGEHRSSVVKKKTIWTR